MKWRCPQHIILLHDELPHKGSSYGAIALAIATYLSQLMGCMEFNVVVTIVEHLHWIPYNPFVVLYKCTNKFLTEFFLTYLVHMLIDSIFSFSFRSIWMRARPYSTSTGLLALRTGLPAVPILSYLFRRVFTRSFSADKSLQKYKLHLGQQLHKWTLYTQNIVSKMLISCVNCDKNLGDVYCWQLWCVMNEKFFSCHVSSKVDI